MLHEVKKGFSSCTSKDEKSRTFLVTRINPCTIAVAAIMASSDNVSDRRCINRAQLRKVCASMGNTG